MVALPGGVAWGRVVPAAGAGAKVCEVPLEGRQSPVGLGPPHLERTWRLRQRSGDWQGGGVPIATVMASRDVTA